MPVSPPHVQHVVSPPATPNETTDLLERLLGENAVVMNGMLEVVHELTASHNDLVEIIDGMAQELAAVSADLAAGKAAGGGRPTPSPVSAAELDESLRQAAALAERAAAILEGLSRDDSSLAVRTRLRSVAG